MFQGNYVLDLNNFAISRSDTYSEKEEAKVKQIDGWDGEVRM